MDHYFTTFADKAKTHQIEVRFLDHGQDKSQSMSRYRDCPPNT